MSKLIPRFKLTPNAHVRQIEDFQKRFTKSLLLSKITTTYSRSSGPGGQNVNKLSTKADIRFNVSQADWLPDPIKENLTTQNNNRINKKCEIVFKSDMLRTQIGNFNDCVDKCYNSIMSACVIYTGPKEETLLQIKKQ